MVTAITVLAEKRCRGGQSQHQAYGPSVGVGSSQHSDATARARSTSGRRLVIQSGHICRHPRRALGTVVGSHQPELLRPSAWCWPGPPRAALGLGEPLWRDHAGGQRGRLSWSGVTDILGNVIPVHRKRRRKDGGRKRGSCSDSEWEPKLCRPFAMERAMPNRVAVEDGHTESFSIRSTAGDARSR